MSKSEFRVENLLVGACQKFPDNVALTDSKGSATYRALYEKALEISQRLSELGIKSDDRVAVIMDKQTEIVATVFACYITGAILVPVNPHLKSRQLLHVLNDSASRLIVATERREQLLKSLDGSAALAACISKSGNIKTFGQNLPPVAAVDPDFTGMPLATLFYTSGSTGLPKAVACTHENIVAGAQSVASYLKNQPDDVLLGILPLSFDAGFSQLTTAFHTGASVVLQDYLLPADIARACARNNVTGITGVPAIWAAAIRANWDDETRKNLRYFANTGGHLPHERIKQLCELFPNALPYPMYGLTEAFRSAYLHPNKVWEKKGSIGTAIPGATLCVVDENGEECVPGQSGELVHAGPTVAAGYWKNPEETQKRFRPAPQAMTRQGITGTVVFSGDLVHRDDDGYLYYETRRDAQVKVAGNRISFAEIEAVALDHPMVRACAAGARKISLEQDPELILFIETDDLGTIPDDLMPSLKAGLPGYTVPSRIFARTRLILNNNNKYDVAQMIKEHCETEQSTATNGTD